MKSDDINIEYNERVQIIMELCFLKQKWKSMTQIIRESNPESLNPIISYNPDQTIIDVKRKTPVIDDDGSGLVILPSYYES